MQCNAMYCNAMQCNVNICYAPQIDTTAQIQKEKIWSITCLNATVCSYSRLLRLDVATR